MKSDHGVATPAGGGQQDEPLSDDPASGAVYLYPFQKAVEARLNGTADENRRYALLLPLHVGLQVYEPTYKMEILSTIGRLNLTEALPLLEEGLKWDSSYWEGGQLDMAARLWMRFRTEGMTEVERARFLATTFRPGFPFRVQNEAAYMLAELGPTGRQHVVAELFALRNANFMSQHDILIAGALRARMSTEPALGLTYEEAVDLAKSRGSFVRYIVLDHFAQRTEEIAVEIATRLVDQGDIAKFRFRGALLYGLAYCPGGNALFVKVLQDIQQEPSSVEAEHELSVVLGGVSNAATGPFNPPPADLAREIKHIAARDIPEPAEPWGKELSLYAARLRSRNWALSILKRWGISAE